MLPLDSDPNSTQLSPKRRPKAELGRYFSRLDLEPSRYLESPAHTTQSTADAQALAAAIRRRRTFAIISHPDAGKTTLTEKLLLTAGPSISPAPSRRAGHSGMPPVT